MILERIRELCKAMGITVSDLEKIAGLSNGAIAKWATGSPRVDSLKRVADCLGCSLDFLVTGV